MKAFLTGASGILGTDIQRVLELNNYEVWGFNSQNIDITSFSDVQNKIEDFKPDVIIHSAAMTNVDGCEDDKDAALLANVIGTHNVSLVAAKSATKVVYVSSCGVYGNTHQSAYTEYDGTNPVNYHHFTKLQGELRIKEHNHNFLIIRPGWLFGGTTGHKKNFIEARRKEALKNPVLKSAIDKVGSPTYTYDAAMQIATLISAETFGTYNVVNEGHASRFEYVSEIIKVFNLPNQMEPVTSNEFVRKANMPDNEMLENKHLSLRGLNNMRNWKEALADYVANTY